MKWWLASMQTLHFTQDLQALQYQLVVSWSKFAIEKLSLWTMSDPHYYLNGEFGFEPEILHRHEDSSVLDQ